MRHYWRAAATGDLFHGSGDDVLCNDAVNEFGCLVYGCVVFGKERSDDLVGPARDDEPRFQDGASCLTKERSEDAFPCRDALWEGRGVECWYAALPVRSDDVGR